MDDHGDLWEQVRRLTKSPEALAITILRYSLVAGRGVLALTVTRGRAGFDEVLAAAQAWIATGADSVPADQAAGYRRRHVAALASVCAGRAAGDVRQRDAATLHRFAYGLGFRERHAEGFLRLLLQTNLAAGEVDYVRHVLATDPEIDDHTRWMIETDLLGPRFRGEAFDPAAWTASFNRLFADSGAVPVRLAAADPGTAWFDRVTSDRPEPVDDPSAPLISVIMSVYAPDQSLTTAIRSVLEQTWARFELLVVDDVSPPEFTATIDAVADWDPRIRVLRMPANGGTYRVRDFALTHARGDYVTFQDSDDWSHPERLARQVEVLRQRPDVVATLSSSVRLGPDLSMNTIGYPATRTNASSLMIRRGAVLDRLGGFDLVRKAGDSEFIERIGVAFGPEALHEIDQVLAVVQLTPDSLSRGDFAHGWHAPARVAYRESFGWWHAKIGAGVASPRLDAGAPRAFPAPARFVAGAAAPTRHDVLYVTDLRRKTIRYGNAPARLRALASAGLDIGAAHTESLRDAAITRRRPLPEVREMLHTGEVHWTLWNEPTHATLTIVDDPELLSFVRDPSTIQVTTDRLVLAVPAPLPAGDSGSSAGLVAMIERNARALFGADPQWLPATETIAAGLRSAGATTVLGARQLDVVELAGPGRRGLRGTRPVVGSAGLERSRADLPSAERLRLLLPDDEAYDVRVLDVRNAVPEALGGLHPAGWLVFRSMAPDVFFPQLDVFVGVAPRSWGPDTPWQALAAVAAGAVAVLDPAYEPLLGPAALYVEPAEVRSLLDSLLADPHALEQQQERARAHLREHFSPDGLVRAVRELIDDLSIEERGA